MNPLEKIQRHGKESLTDEENRFLRRLPPDIHAGE